jgi:hypothetical protein
MTKEIMYNDRHACQDREFKTFISSVIFPQEN